MGSKYFGLKVCLCVFPLAGIDISEEQRRQAIVNARRAKQGKIKSKDKIFLHFKLLLTLYSKKKKKIVLYNLLYVLICF